MNTSILALERLTASGKRATLKRQVYAVCVEPRTASEIASYIKSPRDSISPRIAELRHDGYISMVGERECIVTGELCETWQRSTPSTTPAKKRHRFHAAIEVLRSAGKHDAVAILMEHK